MQNAETEHVKDDLSAWLAKRVATYVRRSPEEIEADVPLAEYGLDSVFALTLVGDIEDHLGLSLEPTVMWDHPTISMLTKALGDLAKAGTNDTTRTNIR